MIEFIPSFILRYILFSLFDSFFIKKTAIVLQTNFAKTVQNGQRKIYDRAESAMKFQKLSKKVTIVSQLCTLETNFDSLRSRFRTEKCSARQLKKQKRLKN